MPPGFLSIFRSCARESFIQKAGKVCDVYTWEGMEKKVLREGSGLYKPRERCRVEIEIEGKKGIKLDEVFLVKETRVVTLGEADDQSTDAIEACLRSMRVGEDSEQRGYRIRLLSFESCKESWELSAREKMDIAVHHKKKGNEKFTSSEYPAAAHRYSNALKYLITIGPHVSDAEASEVRLLKTACHLNLAAAQLKLGLPHHVIRNCSKVLAVDENNCKALFRRGQAHCIMNEFELAEVDLLKAKSLDPKSSAIEQQLNVLASKRKAQNEQYHHALKKMFSSK